MKIKPRLKTHWLASQNPMMVSLEGLKAVVFNPPVQFVDFDFQAPAEQAVEITRLADVKRIGEELVERQDVVTRSNALSRDLFWILFSGYDVWPAKVPALALRELAASIELHYENGESFSLVTAYRKPGLPPFVNPEFYLHDRGCHWEKVLTSESDTLIKPLKILSYQKKNEDFKKAWAVILEILAWSLQRQRQVGDLQVLWTENREAPQKRWAYPLVDIELTKSRPLAATLKAEPLLKNTGKITVWKGYESAPADSTLRLHAVETVYDEAHQTEWLEPSEDEAKLLESRIPDLRWEPIHSAVHRDSKEILNSMAHLRRMIAAENIHLVNHRFLQGREFKPLLRLREEEGSLQMAVRFKMEGTGLLHLNFPASVGSLLHPFFGGLENFFALDRKEMASKQAQFRQNDLLFLRHQGMLVFCLLELINWRLERPLTSGEKIDFVEDNESVEFDRQFGKMIFYLKSSIPGLIGKSNESFEQLFSAEVKNSFLDFTEKLYALIDQDLTLLFQSQNIYEIKNVQKQVLILLRFLILHLVEESGGKVLLKSTSTIGEKLKLALQLWTTPQIMTEKSYDEGVEPYWVDIGVYSKYIINLLFDLIDHEVDVEFNGVPFVSKDNPFEFIFAVTSSEQKEDTNWFDLHPQIFFNGTRILSEEVKLNFTPDQTGFVEYQGQVYRIDKKQIPSLKALQKFWDRIKGQKNKVARNSFGDRVYQLEKSIALELLMLKAQGIQVKAEGPWQRIFDYFENGLGTEKLILPDAMRESLLPHQLEGAQWLYDLHELKLGAILADEMGLGKTFQVLAFLESLQLQNRLGHSLIVVPTSLVYNWLDEKKKFAPDLHFEIFQSADKERLRNILAQESSKVVITTYGLLNENRDFFEKLNWNVLVFDEAQNLKNITSVRSVSARKLNAEFKVCLTGTPMENNYLEFYSLCDLVVPGCLGHIDEFRRNYYNNEVRTEALRELRLITKPLLLRRTKQQVKLSLPVKTIQQVILPFNEKQKDVYKKMAMTFSRQVDELINQSGESRAQIAMFAALMRLRQICSDPAAVPGVDFKERPVKVQHFLSSVQEHLENGESVIVFTQFLSTLNRIESELKKADVSFFTLQGKVSSKDRIKLITAFQQSEVPSVMLMTLKTGGVGLNLTKASVVYHLEPWWNPAVENQATDRAHRMGQTKDVKVFNLLIEGSLEERISELKVKKQGSFDRLFSVEEQIDEAPFESNSSLSREDFLFLLKNPS